MHAPHRLRPPTTPRGSVHRPAALALVALLAAPALAGCALPWGAEPDGGDEGDWWGDVPRPGDDPEPNVIVTFGGRVVDALSGDAVQDATVRIDLAQEAPCRREALLWRDWFLRVEPDGTWGPFEQPAPDSPSYRFFVHADAPGYTRETRYVGPAEAASARDILFVLHPRVAVEGAAPPGTVIALTAPGFPRFTVADANGTFRFEDARTDPLMLVAATASPHREALRAPANVSVASPDETGWTLQGVVKRDDGRPLAARVVAWNGTTLWSAAVTDEVGRFLLSLPAERAELRIEARTEDDRYGGVLARTVQGPPSTAETVIARALC